MLIEIVDVYYDVSLIESDYTGQIYPICDVIVCGKKYYGIPTTSDVVGSGWCIDLQSLIKKIINDEYEN